MKKVDEMFTCYLLGQLTYVKHRITNAACEGINSQVADTTSNALACSENFRNRAIFILGKLNFSHT